MNSKQIDKIWTIIFYLVSGFILLLLISFIGYILIKGSNCFNPKFLFGKPKYSDPGGGIGPQLFNSFYILIVTLIFTVPIGIGAGIYLAEYANKGKLLNIITLCIETMASLPSIVVGLFGLLVFVQFFGWHYSLIAGACALTILNIASMTRVSENAIRAAGVSVKEGSFAVGATKWQTIKKVILPSAIPQILTGIILSAGRIFGEAAALIYTSGMSAQMLKFSNISLIDKTSPFAITRSAETLAVYIWNVNSEGTLPDAAAVANGASAVLVLMVLLFNFLARFIGKKIYESYSGKK